MTRAPLIKRQREKEGQVFKVDLGDGWHGYGRLLTHGDQAFYDIRTQDDMPIEDIIKHPILFRVGVMKYAITKGYFEVIGCVSLEEDLKVLPNYFIYDSLANKLNIYITATGQIRPSSWEEVKDLEVCAVYDPCHVIERLNDHFAGRPNAFVERTKAERDKFKPNCF